ncbi:hypothetical protein [Ruficoccus sp. ZRK36]|uniref:hypothetical protein n=1 Tax=Ruficoccus sp. ZRK36 TaxID=2866311 RepID=UPI001C73361D|nr:hypothetical protein [Ruficoccus sp. ZRK36]QYY35934.1 hypothetical protein K0V07_00325 [Ruficoccus sp. ZRK36]
MSMSGDPFALQITCDLSYQEDFLSVEGADGSVDTEELGLLLGTLNRSCVNAGEVLEAGAWKGLFAFGQGQAMQFAHASERYEYRTWKCVTGWEDFDGLPWDQILATDSLLDVTRLEVADRLSELSGVGWSGIRDFETSQWELCSCRPDVDKDRTMQATRQMLQLDVLLKGHGCPRGRMRVDFEYASLWAWSNSNDDYLMALTDADLTLAARGALLRIGEAFLLF